MHQYQRSQAPLEATACQAIKSMSSPRRFRVAAATAHDSRNTRSLHGLRGGRPKGSGRGRLARSLHGPVPFCHLRLFHSRNGKSQKANLSWVEPLKQRIRYLFDANSTSGSSETANRRRRTKGEAISIHVSRGRVVAQSPCGALRHRWNRVRSSQACLLACL